VSNPSELPFHKELNLTNPEDSISEANDSDVPKIHVNNDSQSEEEKADTQPHGFKSETVKGFSKLKSNTLKLEKCKFLNKTQFKNKFYRILDSQESDKINSSDRLPPIINNQSIEVAKNGFE
jgi:hypothetical protein